MEKNLCVVCEYGWIIVGVEDGTDEEYLFMKNASVSEILANKDLWDEDLTRYADKIKELVK